MKKSEVNLKRYRDFDCDLGYIELRLFVYKRDGRV